MLREKSRAGLKEFGLTQPRALHRDLSADGVAVALGAAQPEGHGRAKLRQFIVENAQLRTAAVLEHNFQPPVVIEVGERKGAAVLDEVESHAAADFRKRPVTI